MISMTKPCYQTCINKKFLVMPKWLAHAKKIITQLEEKTKVGRPEIEFERALAGIYFVLKTGCQWNALPRCFGSYSAVHRSFQKLVSLRFFERVWQHELRIYQEKVGLKLNFQVGDCAVTKAPLGGEATGKNPIDRSKRGTKRSVISDQNGVAIGLAVGGANQYDPALLADTIKSVKFNIQQPYDKKLRLDGIYDTQDVRTILFNEYYVPRISPNNRRSARKRTYAYKDDPTIRWVIERAHSWANRFRRILVRWEKSLKNYVGMLQFAFSINTFNKIPI